MENRDISPDPYDTGRILSELSQVIDEAEIVKYIVRVSDKIHRLKLNKAPSYKIEFLSGQITLLENKLASLRLIRKQKS